MIGIIGCGALGLVFGVLLAILLVVILRNKNPKEVQRRLVKHYLPLFGSEGVVGSLLPFFEELGLEPRVCIPAFWIGMAIVLVPSAIVILRKLIEFTDWKEIKDAVPEQEWNARRERVVKKLTKRQKAVLRLRIGQEKDDKQTATELEITVEETQEELEQALRIVRKGNAE
jgi:hypothetical protein